MVFERTLEMTIGREEFFRLLPAAVETFDLDGDMVRWAEGGCRGTIRLVPLEGRRLGSVVVPRYRVEIALEGWPEEGAEAFMARFPPAFLRGGG